MSAELIVTSVDGQSGLKLQASSDGGEIYVTAWTTMNDDSETMRFYLDPLELAALAAFTSAMSRKDNGT